MLLICGEGFFLVENVQHRELAFICYRSANRMLTEVLVTSNLAEGISGSDACDF
jgi:NH3-dependent NAD+ synthetase